MDASSTPGKTGNEHVVRLRNTALSLFEVAVQRADPALGVQAALQAHAPAIEAASRVFLLALGKAAIPMARAALPLIEAKLAGAVVVTNRDNMADVPGATVIAGGHPLPDEGSVEGAQALGALAQQAGEGDLVLALISGGGSALACAPRQGLTLADKIGLNDALIRCGADINEINGVRSVVSRLKGGGLASLAAPAEMLSLILSDVPHDDLATIASGPTALPDQPYATRVGQAQDVLARYGLNEKIPTVDAFLRQARDSHTAKAPQSGVDNILVGSNALSVEAVLDAAKGQGWRVEHPSAWLDGDVAQAAGLLHALARDADAAVPIAIICGGETTVRVTGTGRGGRNQELALRFALLAQQSALPRAWAFLSGGTDGRDGPTDAAGGIVDAGTPTRILEAGLDPHALLANNDTYRALQTAGDLIEIGATGTNVADIQILLLGANKNAAG